MLVLSRKISEEIVIDGKVHVRILRASRNRASLAIDAPKAVSVDRGEIWLAKKQERLAKGTCGSAKLTGARETRQNVLDGKVGCVPVPAIRSIIGRAISRVNCMAKKDRPQEDRAELDDYRRILRLGIPLGTQHEAARFRAALVRLLDDSQVGDGPPIEFYNDLTTDKARAELQSAVLAIVLELLHNARRHSKSKSILLGITRDDEYLCVQVQDWGIGFDLECEQPMGRGLKGIRRLVAWFGGTLDIDSRFGKGTCVMVEIPLSWEGGPNNQTASGPRPK
jgi:carbon storage regulator CsrA